jgi:hypothetical protein
MATSFRRLGGFPQAVDQGGDDLHEEARKIMKAGGRWRPLWLK